MRHRKFNNKLSCLSAQRDAIVSNLVASIIQHGQITTTVRKARLLKRVAERTVTRATSLGELLLKAKDQLSTEEKARVVHAMRMVRRTVKSESVVNHLFSEVAPRYLDRNGGYTRMIRNGFRKGDGAPMAILQFVEGEPPKKEVTLEKAANK